MPDSETGQLHGEWLAIDPLPELLHSRAVFGTRTPRDKTHPFSQMKVFSAYAEKPLRLVGAALVAVCVASCVSVGPDFNNPTAPLADSWLPGKETRIEGVPVESGAWWKLLKDPVLGKLIAVASDENLTLQGAAVKVAEARANLAIAVGSQFPQRQRATGHAAAVGLSDHAPNVALGDTRFSNGQVGFDAAWELDLWGKFRRGVESADAGMLASLASYDDTLVTVTAEVARVYVVLRAAEERLALARENVVIQQDTLGLANVRFQEGDVSELDVTQARALLRDTEALIPQLQTGIRQAKNALSTLLGKPPGKLADILGKNGRGKEIPVPPDGIAAGIPADLLRRRPDLRLAEHLAAAQSARIGIAEAGLYPTVSLGGSMGFATSEDGGSPSNNATLSDLFKGNSFTYLVGPSVEWPILNYGRIRNRVRVEDARLQQLILAYQNKVLLAAREVEDALEAFARSRETVGYLTEGVKDARRSVDLALIQYREGAVDYQRVLETQRFLVRQQDRHAEKRGDVVLNLVAAYKALGGGWKARRGKGILHERVQKEMEQRTNWGEMLSAPRSTNNIRRGSPHDEQE